MIELTRGDLLSAEAEALVNAVNCVGVMGRGIALAFKSAFPGNFAVYAAACKRGEMRPWKDESRRSDIDSGLDALIADVKRLGIRSIAVPALGCGLGGLDWSEVRPQIERARPKSAW